MGIDLYLDVTASCSLISFIGHCRKLSFDSAFRYNKYNKYKFDKWVKHNPTPDPLKFLSSIGIVYEPKNFTIKIVQWDEGIFGDGPVDETSFCIMDYSDILLFDMIIDALIKNDDDIIGKFCTILDELDELSISKDDRTVTFTLKHVSSHKGLEPVDIDFISIGEEISKMKKFFWDIKVETKLGYE